MEEIYRILRENDMDDVAIKLQTCGSPLLEPNVNNTNLPNCINLTGIMICMLLLKGVQVTIYFMLTGIYVAHLKLLM